MAAGGFMCTGGSVQAPAGVVASVPKAGLGWAGLGWAGLTALCGLQRLYHEVRRALRSLYVRLPGELQHAARAGAVHTPPLVQPASAQQASARSSASQPPAQWFSYTSGAGLRSESPGRQLSDLGDLPGPHGGKQVHIQPRGSPAAGATDIALPQVRTIWRDAGSAGLAVSVSGRKVCKGPLILWVAACLLCYALTAFTLGMIACKQSNDHHVDGPREPGLPHHPVSWKRRVLAVIAGSRYYSKDAYHCQMPHSYIMQCMRILAALHATPSCICCLC